MSDEFPVDVADLERIADSLVMGVLKSTSPLTDAAALFLATHENPQVRAALARSPRPLTVDAFHALAADTERPVRAALTESPRPLPPDVVTALGKDRSPHVRAALARSRHLLPGDLVARLASDSNPMVPLAIIWSPRPAPDELLIRLVTQNPAAHVDPMLARYGVEVPRSDWTSLFRDPATPRVVRVALVAGTASKTLVARAAKDPDPAIRVVAALHDKVTDVALVAMSDDPDDAVREAAAARIVRAALT